jgi:hypothetical protein
MLANLGLAGALRYGHDENGWQSGSVRLFAPEPGPDEPPGEAANEEACEQQAEGRKMLERRAGVVGPKAQEQIRFDDEQQQEIPALPKLCDHVPLAGSSLFLRQYSIERSFVAGVELRTRVKGCRRSPSVVARVKGLMAGRQGG